MSHPSQPPTPEAPSNGTEHVCIGPDGNPGTIYVTTGPCKIGDKDLGRPHAIGPQGEYNPVHGVERVGGYVKDEAQRQAEKLTGAAKIWEYLSSANTWKGVGLVALAAFLAIGGLILLGHKPIAGTVKLVSNPASAAGKV